MGRLQPVDVTIYQAGAQAGSAGFTPVVSGPMGTWSSTPAGHKTLAEFAQHSTLRSSFGVHPGGRFGSILEGTWVAPSSGPVLVRVVLNCDVLFFSDASADGCSVRGGQFDCGQDSDIVTNNGACKFELMLTVTPNAHFEQSADNHSLFDGHNHVVTGIAELTGSIVIPRVPLEARALEMWQRSPEMISENAPTLESLLTDQNALLTSMFTTAQQPHVVYPVSFAVSSKGQDHRRMQLQGDELTTAIETHAPSQAEAKAAMHRLATAHGAVVSNEVDDGTGKGAAASNWWGPGSSQQ